MCGALTISISPVNRYFCPGMGGKETIYTCSVLMLIESPLSGFRPWQGRDVTMSAQFSTHLQAEFCLTTYAY